jgi:hypothetical protein
MTRILTRATATASDSEGRRISRWWGKRIGNDPARVGFAQILIGLGERNLDDKGHIL